ncbi:EscD/YscD/HrpQ family type III secretion system inner membrane ring protein [Klebsiella indica]|uniref:EscD/YscD/HrpQ family type III secretion system inner membrane ring protein n=1 Tax=Klebsiella indica TaxID=2582917 RepID=A0A5R9LDN0_9ENTR|nr:type III secretion system inner membrane ring subunit SctD [Klebsiella indica]TLV11645.1 EscD/YscD/HrpQ family type III secretion system inner membrane ring protein [Klebsiella indica]
MYELRVLTGLHRGAALPLSGQQWCIGAAQDADLALYDPGVKDRHCQLSKTEQGWQALALEGTLNDNEGQHCEALDLQPGTPFALGHIWLCIVSASMPWPGEQEADVEHVEAEEKALPTPAIGEPLEVAPSVVMGKRRLPGWAKVLYLLLGLLLTMMLGSWLLQDSIASPSAPLPPEKPRLASEANARQVIASMLSDRGLGKSVTLSVGNNSLTLSGKLDNDDSQRLDRMLRTFYQRFNVTLQIHNRTSTVSNRLPFNIVQISTGPRANIVTADGQRIFIGDEVDRLRLVAINHDSIEFAGRENIKVKW